LVADLLAVVQALQAGRLDRGDMDEHVLAAVLWHDEPEALRGVEPLDGSYRHISRSLMGAPPLARLWGIASSCEREPDGTLSSQGRIDVLRGRAVRFRRA